jgi:hypothetical protein
MKPPLKLALIAAAALAILLIACYIWNRDPLFESHSELIVRPEPPSK